MRHYQDAIVFYKLCFFSPTEYWKLDYNNDTVVLGKNKKNVLNYYKNKCHSHKSSQNSHCELF